MHAVALLPLDPLDALGRDDRQQAVLLGGALLRLGDVARRQRRLARAEVIGAAATATAPAGRRGLPRRGAAAAAAGAAPQRRPGAALRACAACAAASSGLASRWARMALERARPSAIRASVPAAFWASSVCW